MKKYIALLAGLMISMTLEAKVLVISDIDDTLKVSHVLSKKGAASSFVDESSRFVGMSEIFQMLDLQHEDIEFHYVSLAPKFLMEGQHLDFLEENGFPITELHMNPGMKQDPDLKQKAIRKVLREKNPELVIYFGDNGQFDTVVYDQMSKEFPQIPAISYIREAYSKLNLSKHPTKPGQIGFVTSVEVVIDLISKGLLPQKAYGPIENIVYKRMKRDDRHEMLGAMVFPWWQDCRDFKWVWNIANPSAKLQAIEATIAEKCR
ncbi:phosphatase domain-containing protein [Bdellovibrio svalbardensis]|uniref:App1 family protein n=1 Tax=Bdellovibrio svalbardensis TaxID=2972972 RepID=A0ABT6DIG3_9BACT|nr:phosphatase domain-containing protein [Bdellovibrio svalbardensis]MDG0816641.1 App1 family protein [Bdellovibrio svalbardensis]